MMVNSLSWRVTAPLRLGTLVVRHAFGTVTLRVRVLCRRVGETRFVWSVRSAVLPRRPRFVSLPGEARTPFELDDRRLAELASTSVERSDASRAKLDDMSAVDALKLVAFYLPQFHSIPENDEWWGHGFTEWTSASQARPQFRGHYQPQLPTELGFYDLRDPDVLEQQAALASAYGISGFCFYYYWFNGRRVLERPLDQMRASGRPELPFCFCWANENWTRRWDGREDQVLLRQDYAYGWADRFIRDLLPALVDPRYMRVEDAPLVLVYRALSLPEPQRVAESWRSIAQSEGGIDLHLAAVQTGGLRDPRPFGFDAAVEFPPHAERLPLTRERVRDLTADHQGQFYDYRRAMREFLGRPLPEHAWYRGVMPSWDNTARRGRHGHVYLNSSPSEYALWLRKVVLQTLIRARVQEPLVFLNAWNEWGEGTHLEPDDRYGRAWLEATLAGLRDGIRQYCAYRGELITAGEVIDRLERRPGQSDNDLRTAAA